MVCGRLARSIALVVLPQFVMISETTFSLPKPLVHIFYRLVNVVFEGSFRRG